MQQNSDKDLKIEDHFQAINSPKNEVQSSYQVIYPYKATFASKKQIKPTSQTLENFKKKNKTNINDRITFAIRQQDIYNMGTSEQQILNKSQQQKISNKFQLTKTNNINEARQILSQIPSLSKKNFNGSSDRNPILYNTQKNQSDSNFYTNRSSRQSMHLFQNQSESQMNQNSLNQVNLKQQQSINKIQQVNQCIDLSTPQILNQSTKQMHQIQLANSPLNENEKIFKLNMIISNADSLSQKQPFIKECASDDKIPLLSTERYYLHEQQIQSSGQINAKQELQVKKEIVSNSHKETGKRTNKNFIRPLNLERFTLSNDIQNNLISQNRQNKKLLSSSIENHKQVQGILTPKNIREIKDSQSSSKINDQFNHKCAYQSITQQQEQQLNVEIEISQNGIDKSQNEINQNQQSLQTQNNINCNSLLEDKTWLSKVEFLKEHTNYNLNIDQGQHVQTHQFTNHSKSSTCTPRSNYANQKLSKNKSQFPFYHQSTILSRDDQSIVGQLFLSNLSKYQTCYTTRKNSNSSLRKSMAVTKINLDSSSPPHKQTASLGFYTQRKDENQGQIKHDNLKQQTQQSQTSKDQIIEQSQQNKTQEQLLKQQREYYVTCLNKSQFQNRDQEQIQNYFNQLKEKQINQIETYQNNPYFFLNNDIISYNQHRTENLISQLNIKDKLNQIQQTQTLQPQNYKNKLLSYSQHQEKQEFKSNQEKIYSNLQSNQDIVKEEQELDIQNTQNAFNQRSRSFSNLLQNNNFQNYKVKKNKQEDLFQIYKDSVNYLINSKKSIPQKPRNLIYKYQRGIKHKSSNSSIEAIYSVEIKDTKNNNSHLSKQQIQEIQEKKRCFKSIYENTNKQVKHIDENYFPKNDNLIHLKSFDKKQIVQNTKLQQNIQNQILLTPRITERNIKQSITLTTQSIKDSINYSPKIIENNKQKNQRNSPQRLQDKIQTRSRINNNNYINKDIIINDQAQNKKTISDKMQSRLESKSSLNRQNSPQFSSLNNSHIDQNVNEIQYTSFSERIKNDSYQSDYIAQELINKRKIDEDPEIAEQKIKISKYFMDETISIQEKRCNFKEIQILFQPESSYFNENICNEILPFLNVLKDYFLKLDSVPPNKNILKKENTLIIQDE